MTLQVLTQGSVDNLRMIAQNTEVLDLTYEELVENYHLQEIELEIEFDCDVSLKMPKGDSQENNNDDTNCLLIVNALPSLNDIDATDERLWVTLGLRDFRSYATARWPAKNDQKTKNNTINHWFAGTSRGLMRDHAISRLWWYHRLCSRVNEQNVRGILDLLFFNSDYRSSMLERNTTSAITEVVGTIIEITDEYSKQGISYNREKFRSFMKELDLLAGRSRLAVLSKEQLKGRLTSLYLKAHD
jgi:hypothetical protein